MMIEKEIAVRLFMKAYEAMEKGSYVRFSLSGPYSESSCLSICGRKNPDDIHGDWEFSKSTYGNSERFEENKAELSSMENWLNSLINENSPAGNNPTGEKE